MRITIRQLKNIIKEAIMDSGEGDFKLSDEKADKMLDVLFSLEKQLNRKDYGKIMPWSRVIRTMEEEGIKTSKEEIKKMFSDSYEPNNSSIAAGIDEFRHTNEIKENGILIDDPAAL